MKSSRKYLPIVNTVNLLYTYGGDNMKIQEVIIVEGKHDSATLKQYFEVDTVETNGSAIDDQTICLIQQLQKTRGVIIFTDPDYPGQRIRNKINQSIDGCKNVFIPKNQAIGKHKVGIEHASKEDLIEALSHVVTFQMQENPQIMMNMLIAHKLQGYPNSAMLRYRLCQILHIGPCNAKTLCQRLNLMQIDEKQLNQLMEDIQ